jgi:hypothetical protein
MQVQFNDRGDVFTADTVTAQVAKTKDTFTDWWKLYALKQEGDVVAYVDDIRDRNDFFSLFNKGYHFTYENH